MKWKILYEVKYNGIWEYTIDGNSIEEAIENIKEIIPDNVAIIRVEKVSKEVK